MASSPIDRIRFCCVRRVKSSCHLANTSFCCAQKNRARLFINGKLVVEQTKELNRNADGHEETPELPGPIRPGHRPAAPAHHEVTTRIDLPAGKHQILLDGDRRR